MSSRSFFSADLVFLGHRRAVLFVHGRGFTTMAIGKAMKAIGFEAKKYRGTYKYIAVLADYYRQLRERKQDAAEDTVLPF